LCALFKRASTLPFPGIARDALSAGHLVSIIWDNRMSRVFGFVYGVACYLFFFFVFLYLIAFIADVPVVGWVSKTVSHGPLAGGFSAAIMNIFWLSLFGVQHSVMARAGFKKWIARVVPSQVERSTYVLASSLVLALAMWQWQPIEGRVWQFEGVLAQYVLWGLFAFGWVLIFVATFLTDHFDLFGLRQVYLNLVRKTYTHVEFKTVFLYKWMRHPMMLGLLIAFWATPVMTLSHLLFSVVMSIYVFIGIHFEERGLLRVLGQDYAEWRSKTPMVLPF
jgi:protein-S-isoprenylcysteine O-methyltransferase Ste14